MFLAALALEHQVGLADGGGLRVDFLAVEDRGDLFALLRRQFLQRLFRQRQHSPGPAGTVIKGICGGLDLVGDGQKHQLRHKPDRIARGPVLAGFLVVFFVEATNEFLEHRAHRVVVEPWELDVTVLVLHRLGAQVHSRRRKLFDQGPKRVALAEPGDLIPELEVVEDLLRVRGKPVEVGFEVCLELRLAGPCPEVAQRELRSVVESLSRRLAQGGVLVDHASAVKHFFHVQDVLLGAFKHDIEPAQHRCGQETSRYLPLV